MRYVIVDLEATCWEKGTDRLRMEIIEIGAVLLASGEGPVVSEFGEFVRPVVEPTLSDFCRQLTHIRQHDVDSADRFPAVFARFLHWIGAEPFMLCSWGAYDLDQFRTDCGRHAVPFPASFERHINLKREFAVLHKSKPCGMAAALRRMNLPLEGTHHRARDDARNIARIARSLLPILEAHTKPPE